MIRKRYCGVLNKINGKYILYNNSEDINLSKDFDIFWRGETKIHIVMNNDVKTILNECGDIYLDKDEKMYYRYHINGINIEEIFNNHLQELITVDIDILDVDREEINYVQEYK